ncbi:bifunctional folylpolyglutamate synthase/dihydrofolate synthase [Bacteroides heparinolyticus]|uniref:bifunctional folylpolyglutamate synthase/dihydrofolate synthase n=1 Tax=Prevotella heparinolytica TaxID=28113 RepID=UPI003F9F2041
MNYEETINYLYNAAPAFEKVGAGAYKEGLSNTHILDKHFNHPHKQFKTIHIAGTNGKGSCSHTLAAILQSQGYKVGLYTSPHLVDFRERIRVNRECISEERVIRFVEKEKSFFEPLQPSFFELTTALAFLYFAEQNVDIAVIEVGLGGRLDCTNIITPILSVITNISFDHTQFLGNTLAKIAREKAGIIKNGVPVLVGETCEETRPVFEQVAREHDATLYYAEDNIIEDDYEFELKGAYQEKNKNTILNIVRLLRNQIDISNDAVINGMKNVCELTGLMGRWQTISNTPLTICDTGHNLAGWKYLHKQIKETYEAIRSKTVNTSMLRIVFGMVDDKDIEAVMELLPKNATYYYCQASTHRAIPSTRINGIALNLNISGQAFSTVEEAYNAVRKDAMKDEFIFIGGSSYVVADLFTYLKKHT